MTKINNFDDILDAMDADPRLAEALRERILTRELIQLPAVVQGLSNRVDAVSNRLEVLTQQVEALAGGLETLTQRVDAIAGGLETLTQRVEAIAGGLETLTAVVQQFIVEQRAFNERLDQSIEELKIANGNAITRMDRMEQDSSFLKNFATETNARRYVESVADDMDLTYVRTLTTRNLIDMAEGHLQGAVRRSFIRADLVMEVVDDGQPGYAAVEVSYTTDTRDTNRAIRNAGYITRFTGLPCHPGIVGVRRDGETAALVDAGTVRWSEVEDWYRPSAEGMA